MVINGKYLYNVHICVMYCFGSIYIGQNIQLILPELSISEGARSRQRKCCKIKKIR